MSATERVFVDSNVLYSASLQVPNNFEGFWRIPEVDILTSQYSIAEVSRNLKAADDRARLWRLIYMSHLVADGEWVKLNSDIILPTKDHSILRAAIAGDASRLITGDVKHFGPYFGKLLQGVFIEAPAEFRGRYPLYFRRGESSK